MAQPDTDAPTQRILAVIEAISQHGPITLMQLTEVLPFSRAAIWRAVDTLRAAGWVRMRPGDKAYEIRAAVIARLSNAHLSNPTVEAMSPLFDDLAAIGPVHVDLGGFTETGDFKLLQTSRKTSPDLMIRPLSLVFDDLAIAAQLTLSPPKLVVHLRAFIVSASEEERRIVTSGEHGRMISKLRDHGHIWQSDRTGAALSLPEFPGFALRAELWRVTKADISAFESRVARFILAQSGKAKADGQASPPAPRGS